MTGWWKICKLCGFSSYCLWLFVQIRCLEAAKTCSAATNLAKLPAEQQALASKLSLSAISGESFIAELWQCRRLKYGACFLQQLSPLPSPKKLVLMICKSCDRQACHGNMMECLFFFFFCCLCWSSLQEDENRAKWAKEAKDCVGKRRELSCYKLRARLGLQLSSSPRCPH